MSLWYSMCAVDLACMNGAHKNDIFLHEMHQFWFNGTCCNISTDMSSREPCLLKAFGLLQICCRRCFRQWQMEDRKLNCTKRRMWNDIERPIDIMNIHESSLGHWFLMLSRAPSFEMPLFECSFQFLCPEAESLRGVGSQNWAVFLELRISVFRYSTSIQQLEFLRNILGEK